MTETKRSCRLTSSSSQSNLRAFTVKRTGEGAGLGEDDEFSTVTVVLWASLLLHACLVSCASYTPAATHQKQSPNSVQRPPPPSPREYLIITLCTFTIIQIKEAPGGMLTSNQIFPFLPFSLYLEASSCQLTPAASPREAVNKHVRAVK